MFLVIFSTYNFFIYLAQSLKYYGNHVTNGIQNVLLIIAMTGAERLMKEKRMFFLNMSTRFRLVFEECFTYVFRVSPRVSRHAQTLKDDDVLYTRFSTKQNEFVPNKQTIPIVAHSSYTSAWHSGRIVLDRAPPLPLVIVNAPGRRRCGLLFISIVNIIIIIYVRCIRLQTAIQLWPTVVLPTTT